MKKGGYIIIDFQNVNLIINGNVVIKGMFDKVGKTVKTGKAVLLSGLVLSGTKRNDIFTFIIKHSSGYSLQLGVDSDINLSVGPTIYTMFVHSNDTVTILARKVSIPDRASTLYIDEGGPENVYEEVILNEK